MAEFTLYHGTCSTRLKNILKHGLKAPVYLTDEPGLAFDYSEQRCREARDHKHGDGPLRPVILAITIRAEDEDYLEADSNMFMFPDPAFMEVTATELQEQWPEPSDYDTSLRLVHSAVLRKNVPPSRIKKRDAPSLFDEYRAGIRRGPVHVRRHARRRR